MQLHRTHCESVMTSRYCIHADYLDIVSWNDAGVHALTLEFSISHKLSGQEKRQESN